MRAWEIQKAVYTKLTADAALMALVEGVFDWVQEGQAFPYITIGEGSSVERDNKTHNAVRADLMVHVWSNSGPTGIRGRDEARQISQAVYDALHWQPLTIENYDQLFTRWTFGETILDVDGVTYHGVQRFEILAHET